MDARIFSAFTRRISCLLVGLFLIVFASPVNSQTEDDLGAANYSSPDYRTLPYLEIIDDAVGLQGSLFPDWYRTHSARGDLAWVRRNDSTLRAFLDSNRVNIVATLSDYAGIDWAEGEVDLYLLRYYRSAGEGDPLILPLGGIRKGVLATAMPSGAHQQFNLIYQLARRMLGQFDRTAQERRHPAAGHPLVQAGPYRRDNLAMLLALVTSQQVIGFDSTFMAYNSGFWQNNHPGREVFEQYLLKDWILTPDRPLTEWLMAEPYNSTLVQATRPPRRRRPSSTTERVYIEGLPIGGELGFSTRIDGRNRLVVDKIDPTRLAYASGLQEGDIIRSVDGSRVRNQKELVEKILAGLENYGATLDISRENTPTTVIVQPMDLSDPDALFLWEEAEDTLYQPPPMPGDSF